MGCDLKTCIANVRAQLYNKGLDLPLWDWVETEDCDSCVVEVFQRDYQDQQIEQRKYLYTLEFGLWEGGWHLYNIRDIATVSCPYEITKLRRIRMIANNIIEQHKQERACHPVNAGYSRVFGVIYR